MYLDMYTMLREAVSSPDYKSYVNWLLRRKRHRTERIKKHH